MSLTISPLYRVLMMLRTCSASFSGSLSAMSYALRMLRLMFSNRRWLSAMCWMKLVRAYSSQGERLCTISPVSMVAIRSFSAWMSACAPRIRSFRASRRCGSFSRDSSSRSLTMFFSITARLFWWNWMVSRSSCFLSAAVLSSSGWRPCRAGSVEADSTCGRAGVSGVGAAPSISAWKASSISAGRKTDLGSWSYSSHRSSSLQATAVL